MCPAMLIIKCCPQVCYGRQAQHVDILFTHVRRHRHSPGAHAHLRRLLEQQAVPSPQLLWVQGSAAEHQQVLSVGAQLHQRISALPHSREAAARPACSMRSRLLSHMM